jgi:dTDP-4-amino-4,6-dideoxygalactose transaminase
VNPREYKHPVIGREERKAVLDTLNTSMLSGFRGSGEGHKGGERVQALEAAFREYHGCKHAIAMQSATAGLHASLVACGVGPGDEVIVTPYSFSASVSCVLMVGATPVFVDIDEETLCMNPAEALKAIASKTKAVIPVDLMGRPLPLTWFAGLPIIEDTAQALGASVGVVKAGTFGKVGIFSFNQSKPVSTGEGGMLITNDDLLARKIRAIRNHGEVSDPDLQMVGYNYRLNEIEAALALVQFKKLDRMRDYRQKLTDYMTKCLSEIEGIEPPYVGQGVCHAWYTYSMRWKRTDMTRTEFQQKCQARGLYMGAGYVKPLYMLPIYQKVSCRVMPCPVTERMWSKELMVIDWLKYPCTKKDVDWAIDIIKEVLK